MPDTSSLRSQDPEPLIKTVMGYQMVDPDIPNLKYGRLMEPEARKTYDAIQKKRHQHHETKEYGLFIHPKKIYLGASPDALVSCTCCHEGLLEIKCPRIIATEVPTANNVTALTCVDGRTRRKATHSYYHQVQWQMGVTGTKMVRLFYVYQGWTLLGTSLFWWTHVEWFSYCSRAIFYWIHRSWTRA